jgi:putative membrane protein
MIIMEKDKNIWVWIFIAVIVVLFLVGSLGMGSYGMMGFGFISMLLFWGFVIWLIVTLINASSQSNKNEIDSLTILKNRYALGELTKKQYESMREEIEQ